MKRRVLALLLFIVTSFAAEANPVDMTTVRDVAVRFMNANAKVVLQSVDDLQLVTTYSISRGEAAFYVFNTPNGFVIVSADDCATPILGYSDEGQFDVDNIPIQLQGYLQGFVEQIEYGIENHLSADGKTAREWELVKATGRLNDNRDGEGVEPLVTAMWSQDCYYNAKCPEDPEGPCGHAVVGCVATAMGMILHYWGYPAQGTGSHTYTPMPYPTTQYPEQSVNFGETIYNWANMPDQLTDTSTQAEIDAVATLLWHCGVAVDMNYSPYGSGTDEHFTTLIDYFGYSDDLHWESRQDDETWKSLLKADLNLSRPVFYTGFRGVHSGHAFVCDGYDVNDRFHFNWGWNGSSNGYFALDATMLFVYNNEAIFNIHPDADTIPQTQIVNFDSGWNWFSSNLDITLEDLEAALVEALDSTTITIKSKNNGITTYSNGSWRGQLDALDVTQMYRVSISAACEISLTGTPVNPAEHPITIENGANWIGFPLSESMSLSNAFAGFAVNGDVIKAKNLQSATYNGTQWRGTLNTLLPGQGYIYKSNSTETRSFTFPTSTK